MGEEERTKKAAATQAGEGRREESSVLFSLRELMTLEEERTAEERQREADAREANRHARMQAELRMRASEEARMRENEARRVAEQATLREEAARHEAMRLGAVERARIQAEQGARLQAMELERKHERALAVIHTDEDKLRYKRVALLGTGVFALVLASGLGFYFGVQQPKSEAAQAELQREIVAAKASADVAKRQADETDAKIDALEKALAKERDENKRGKIQDQLDVLHGVPVKPPTIVHPPPPPPPTTTSAPCNPHDPIDPCLKNGAG